MKNKLFATLFTATLAKKGRRRISCPAKQFPMAAELGGYQPDEEHPPIEIILTPDRAAGQPQDPLTFTIIPDAEIGKAVNHDENSGITVFARGRIQSGGQEVTGEVAITIPPPVTETSVADEMPVRSTSRPDATKSSVEADSDPTGTQIPETPVQARTAPMSSPTEEEKSEEGNEKFVFVGNPVRDPTYRVRKSGKRVADFILATNPTEDDPGYRQIRAFDDLAEKVRDQVRKGQTGIEATVYGPKHWTTRRKTQQGWKETEVTGYYAGFVKIPKRYRQGEAQGK